MRRPCVPVLLHSEQFFVGCPDWCDLLTTGQRGEMRQNVGDTLVTHLWGPQACEVAVTMLLAHAINTVPGSDQVRASLCFLLLLQFHLASFVLCEDWCCFLVGCGTLLQQSAIDICYLDCGVLLAVVDLEGCHPF